MVKRAFPTSPIFIRLFGFCLLAAVALQATTIFADTPDSESLRNIIEQECFNLDKDKLIDLITPLLSSELEKGISPDLRRIIEGVIRRTDFDGISEEKTVEIIGVVNGAYKKGAPLEFLDDIFDVAYVNTITVDQMYAAANALKEFSASDVPQDIYEEFVYHSIEDDWNPAALPVLTRGLIYGVDRGLTPSKVALIIMLDVKNGEFMKKAPEQLVMDSIKLVREKEPGNWKPMSEAEKAMAAQMERKRTLEKRKRELEETLDQKERAVLQAETGLKELKEYPEKQEPGIDVEKLNRDLEILLLKLQGEIMKAQQQHGNIVAELEATKKDVDRRKAIKDRERREKREREFARKQEHISAHGRQGRLNRDKLFAAVDGYIGTPYRFGGDSERGIDCSAFTRRVYREQGVELPRSSREQARVCGNVPYNSVKTGDLIFFNTSINGVISHVGVYLGGNTFAHASSSKGVTRSSLKEKYYVKRFVKGGRIFGD